MTDLPPEPAYEPTPDPTPAPTPEPDVIPDPFPGPEIPQEGVPVELPNGGDFGDPGTGRPGM